MFNKFTHVPLFVNDQDEALNFYRDKVGLKVHTDAQMEGMRWLTLSAPTQPDFELVLMPATTPETKALVGKQAPGSPFVCVESSDVARDIDELRAKGVKIVQEPQVEPWGTSAMFVDLYGNMIYIVQPPR